MNKQLLSNAHRYLWGCVQADFLLPLISPAGLFVHRSPPLDLQKEGVIQGHAGSGHLPLASFRGIFSSAGLHKCHDFPDTRPLPSSGSPTARCPQKTIFISPLVPKGRQVYPCCASWLGVLLPFSSAWQAPPQPSRARFKVLASGRLPWQPTPPSAGCWCRCMFPRQCSQTLCSYLNEYTHTTFFHDLSV